MQLIPCDQFSLLTSKPLPEVIALVEEAVQVETFAIPDVSDAPFAGSISESGFELHRVVSGPLNLPLVYLDGNFSVSTHGVTIRVRQNINLFYIFGLPLLFLAFVTIIALLPDDGVGTPATFENLLPGVIFYLILIPYLTCSNFYQQTKINRCFFYKLIHGTELPQLEPTNKSSADVIGADLLFEQRLLKVIKWGSLAIVGLFLFAIFHLVRPSSDFTEQPTPQPATQCSPTTITDEAAC
ncbi:MAG: hypothetical protein F6J87_13530 [Spirulina sp. SIO3F2]|nr:hypothetical protein [Spirulina sp. SIO3F2]